MDAVGLSQLWTDIRNGVPAARLGMKQVKIGTLLNDSNFSMNGSSDADGPAANTAPAYVSDIEASENNYRLTWTV